MESHNLFAGNRVDRTLLRRDLQGFATTGVFELPIDVLGELLRRRADSTYLVAAVEVVRPHERDVLGRLLAQEEQGNGQHRRVLLIRSANSHALGAGVVGNHLAANQGLATLMLPAASVIVHVLEGFAGQLRIIVTAIIFSFLVEGLYSWGMLLLSHRK